MVKVIPRGRGRVKNQGWDTRVRALIDEINLLNTAYFRAILSIIAEEPGGKTWTIKKDEEEIPVTF